MYRRRSERPSQARRWLGRIFNPVSQRQAQPRTVHRAVDRISALPNDIIDLIIDYVRSGAVLWCSTWRRPGPLQYTPGRTDDVLMHCPFSPKHFGFYMGRHGWKFITFPAFIATDGGVFAADVCEKLGQQYATFSTGNVVMRVKDRMFVGDYQYDTSGETCAEISFFDRPSGYELPPGVYL